MQRWKWWFGAGAINLFLLVITFLVFGKAGLVPNLLLFPFVAWAVVTPFLLWMLMGRALRRFLRYMITGDPDKPVYGRYRRL